MYVFSNSDHNEDDGRNCAGWQVWSKAILHNSSQSLHHDYYYPKISSWKLTDPWCLTDSFWAVHSNSYESYEYNTNIFFFLDLSLVCLRPSLVSLLTHGSR